MPAAIAHGGDRGAAGDVVDIVSAAIAHGGDRGVVGGVGAGGLVIVGVGCGVPAGVVLGRDRGVVCDAGGVSAGGLVVVDVSRVCGFAHARAMCFSLVRVSGGTTSARPLNFRKLVASAGVPWCTIKCACAHAARCCLFVSDLCFFGLRLLLCRFCCLTAGRKKASCASRARYLRAVVDAGGVFVVLRVVVTGIEVDVTVGEVGWFLRALRRERGDMAGDLGTAR